MKSGAAHVHSLRTSIFLLEVIVMSLVTSVVSFAQQLAYESPAGTKFLVYTPPGYSTSSGDHPLMLSLHSKGEVGDDLTLLTSRNREQMPSRLIYLNKWPSTLPFVVVTPQLKPDPNDPEIQWSADYINEVVTWVLANFRIDEQRIYVTGISRGGTGAWTYAAAFPEKVAALVPISGRSDVTQACRIKNIPVWAFHGDGDAVAPPEYSIDMVNAVKACQSSGSYMPRLNLLSARDHNGWNEIYNGSSGYDIFSWLLQFSKNDLSNKRPYVNAGRDLRMQLRAQPIHVFGDVFDWDGSVANINWKQISGTPLVVSGTQTGLLKIVEPKAGSFIFQLSAVDDKGVESTDNVEIDIINSTVEPSITHLVLIDGKTNMELGNLFEGQIIDKESLGLSEINVKAIAGTGTASVHFTVNSDQLTRLQNTGPYYIKHPTNYPEWKVRPGVYVICATPYPKAYGGGAAGITQCYQIAVTDGLTPATCPGTGTIKHELWTQVAGRYTASIPVNLPPSSITDLTVFETPRNTGDSYGSRVRGYVCVPQTGDYSFWIASDDTGELWLSTDEHAANKRKIASVSGWTNYREWTKYASQRSAAISLVAGRKYYIEALHKEASGGDHLSVGWQLPDATFERPIPGNRLMPFAQTSTCAGSGTIRQEVWWAITGRNISSIPLTSAPSDVYDLASFSTRTNIADNYGSRVRGYVCAPVTGAYIFSIASDDNSELWLSPDDNPTTKVKIAYVAGWTRPGEWAKYASQQSRSINLVGGRRYYIEALLKEGTGGDHLSVGWQIPDGTLQRPIPGDHLSPFDVQSSAQRLTTPPTTYDPSAVSPMPITGNITDVIIYPNPVAGGGTVEIHLPTPQADENLSTDTGISIEIVRVTGDVIFSETFSSVDAVSRVLSLQLDERFVAGVYIVRINLDAGTYSRRLVVR